MKKRERKKPSDILNVILRDERVGYTATIKDVSKTGMSVFSDHVFPTYKMIDILIKIGEEPIQLKGSVRWVKESLTKLINGSACLILLCASPAQITPLRWDPPSRPTPFCVAPTQNPSSKSSTGSTSRKKFRWSVLAHPSVTWP